MIFIYILIFIVILFLLFDYFTKDYLNPYKLIMIFGKKGAGKTTLLTKIAIKHIKAGYTVYSTIRIPGTIYFNVTLIGTYSFKPDSVVLIDEVGMVWDNRDYKNFKPEVRDFFKLQRHYKLKIYLFSQTFDVDKKLRDLTDSMYLLESKLRLWSVAKKIDKTITISKQKDEDGKELNSTLIEDYKFEPFIIPGSRIITYIPRYACFFDSHEMTLSNKMPGKITPFLNDTEKLLNRSVWRKYRRKQQLDKVKTSLLNVKNNLHITFKYLPNKIKIFGIYVASVAIGIYDSLMCKIYKEYEPKRLKWIEMLKFEREQLSSIKAMYSEDEWNHRFDYLVDENYHG